MQATELAYRAMQRLAALAMFASLGLSLSAALPLSANAEPTGTPPCNPPQDVVRLSAPLKHVARKLANGEPITIVALGSSSTAGAGATSSTASYPSQLALELSKQFPRHTINVINRGVNGEEVPDMLKRFDSAVVASKPDLLLWQLGTNSLIRDKDLNDPGATIREGLDKARAIGSDIVLVDPQYVPKVIAKSHAPQMIDYIASTAKLENIGVFRRFDVMKRWVENDHLPFASFVIADGLHLNDWGYACMAKGLAMAISEAATRPVLSATAAPATVRPVVAAKSIAPPPRYDYAD